MDAAENEAAVPCDEAGIEWDDRLEMYAPAAPCYLREVELLPANRLAWELFFSSRLESADIVFALRPPLELTEAEASELAFKLEVMAVEYAKMSDEEDRRMKREIARKGAHA